MVLVEIWGETFLNLKICRRSQWGGGMVQRASDWSYGLGTPIDVVEHLFAGSGTIDPNPLAQ